MIEILYWGTFIFSGVIAFSKSRIKNKNIYNFFVFATLVCIVLIVSSNRDGNDIINYVRSYNSVKTFTREPIYELLELIGSALKLNFYQFRTVISAIGYFLIAHTLNKYTRNIELVLFFYCFSLVFMDSWQIRNFIALSIFVFSIRFLFDLKDNKNLFFYLICVIIEMGIHTAFGLNLILLLLLIKGRKIFTRILFFFGTVLLVFTLVNNKEIPFLQNLIFIFSGESDFRYEMYFSSKTGLGFIVPCFLYFVGLFLLFVVKRQLTSSNFSNLEKKYLDVVIMINLCFILILPLTVLNLTFYRLYRNLLLINISVYSNGYFLQNKINKRILILISTALICVGWFVFDILIYSSTHYLVKPIFEGEFFWI